MLLLTCLVNLVFYAIIALFVLWVLSYVLSMFGFPGVWPGAGNPPAGPVVSLVYLLIGLILLLNFLICAFGGGHPILPPIWTGEMR
jgi:hypothetical protein